jgi:3-phenylpropionate/trans-cinnamate dioxygenase ferredoxin component
VLRQEISLSEGNWVAACDVGTIGDEDVISFEHGGETYAIYHTPTGYYATDGFCTHEMAELADGLVIGDIIECPFHNGRFHIPTGAAKSPPVCVDLKTYPVKVEGGKILIDLPG